MKVRGSLTITKSLILPNPNGTTPVEGLFALADATGSVFWSDLLVPLLDVNKNYVKVGTLVMSNYSLFFTIMANASGALPLDPIYWAEVGNNAGGGTTLPQNQIDALDAATSP